MFESYFQSGKEDELALGQEIKTFLKEHVLKTPSDQFLIIEFHEFELTPKKIYQSKSKEEFTKFAHKHTTFRPRLILVKTESEFFAEFNGAEVQLGFDLNQCDILMRLWHIMPQGFQA